MTTATAKKPAAEKEPKRAARPRKVEDVASLMLPATALRVFKALLECVSRDEARPLLTCIHAQVEKEKAELVATDSYRMGIARFEAPGSAEGTVLIPWTPLRSAWRCFTETQLFKMESGTAVSQSDASVALSLPGATFTAEPVEGKYPNYREVTESAYGTRYALDPDEMAFNPLYLSSLGPIARAITRRGMPVVRPYLYGKNKPARFALVTKVEGIEFTYLVMPMRIS